MKVTAFLLLFVLVYVGVAAYMLQQRGLLSRETLDLYLGEKPEEHEGVKIDIEPIGLALSVRKNEEKLQEQARDIELRTERLQAQRKELDAQRALLEQSTKEFTSGTEGAAGRRATGSRLMFRGGPNVISEEMLQLVKMYENMPPDDAAEALENMPDYTVAQVLLQMRSRQAAQIMAELNKDKATEVGKLLSADNGIKRLSKPESVAAP